LPVLKVSGAGSCLSRPVMSVSPLLSMISFTFFM